MKKAFITGITGQDGSYLAELLLAKGYEVHGLRRRSSILKSDRIDHLYHDPHDQGARLYLYYGDMNDASSLATIVAQVKPDEIYNLAAQSHVAVSFEAPEYSADAGAVGTVRLLEAIRVLGQKQSTKFYQASTSELFGLVREFPQSESTPFYPRSPYAAAKLYAYWITVNYREAYNMFAVNGILFNHESPRRGETFVTRKITLAATQIAVGLKNTLYLGNLNSKRDWGHAKDYVYAQWLMLQQERPQDYVIATGKQYSVRQFCEAAFHEMGVEIEWRGEGVDEVGIVASVKDAEVFRPARGHVAIRVDPDYFRLTEVETLLGDATKAKTELGWEPKIGFVDLVREMIQSDMKVAKLARMKFEHGIEWRSGERSRDASCKDTA